MKLIDAKVILRFLLNDNREQAEVYRDTTLDFVDCVLIGRNRILREDILSFDKKLNNQLRNV